jgi:hypothetical protein
MFHLKFEKESRTFEIRDMQDRKITEITVNGNNHEQSKSFVKQLYEKGIFYFRYANPWLVNEKNKDGFCDGRLGLYPPHVGTNKHFSVAFFINNELHNSYDVA